MRDRWLKAQVYEKSFWEKLDLNENWERKLKEGYTKEIEFRKKRILDLGCGPRGVIHYIKDAEIKIGLDPLIQEYKKKYKLDPKTIFIKGKGENIPLLSNSFDFVFCINTLDHTEYPDVCLKEIRRVLKSDGILIFEINTYIIPELYLRIIREKTGIHMDKGHPYSYSFNEIKNLLQSYFLVESYRKVRDYGRTKTYSFVCRMY